MEQVNARIILPTSGIWNIEDFAAYLEMEPAQLQQKLTNHGIHVMVLSNRYKHKLVKLEDIAQAIGKGAHAVQEGPNEK